MNLSVMLVLEPPYKNGVTESTAKPRRVEASVAPILPTRLVVNFTNVFSDKYGEIVAYTVIVSEVEDTAALAGSSVLPGWREARADKNIKAYQVYLPSHSIMN